MGEGGIRRSLTVSAASNDSVDLRVNSSSDEGPVRDGGLSDFSGEEEMEEEIEEREYRQLTSAHTKNSASRVREGTCKAHGAKVSLKL